MDVGAATKAVTFVSEHTSYTLLYKLTSYLQVPEVLVQAKYLTPCTPEKKY